jgi:hypothetical protein
MRLGNNAVAFILIIAALSLSGCAKKMAVAPPPSLNSMVADDSERLQQSLFKGDQAVLSNEEIDRILNGRIVLTERHRLAVLGLNPKSYWSPSVADQDSQNMERFLQELRSSTQFKEVRFVPSLLIPERRTVPYLREAAARFQADLLLVYTTRIQTFRQYRVFGSDEVRARCLAESVLLDVRTGVAAHTAISSEIIDVKKSKSDLNFSETIAKAEADATGKALLSLAKSVNAYFVELLKSVPVSH